MLQRIYIILVVYVVFSIRLLYTMNLYNLNVLTFRNYYINNKHHHEQIQQLYLFCREKT
jgi:hypothetical protein